MIRAVTYDCWQTLLRDRTPNGANAVRAEALASVAGTTSVRAAAVLHEAWQRHHEEWLSRRVFSSRHMAEHALGVFGIVDPVRRDELAVVFEEATLAPGAEAVDGAAETLGALRDAGVRVAVVCDTGWSPGRVVRRLLGDAGLGQFVEAWAFSDEVGVPKPAAAMFATALGPFGVRPEEAVHVGDLRRTDVAGARGFGMRAARFRGVHDDGSADDREGDVVLDRHVELLDHLEVWGR